MTRPRDELKACLPRPDRVGGQFVVGPVDGASKRNVSPAMFLVVHSGDSRSSTPA